MSVALGLIGLVAAVLQMVDPASMVGIFSYFACLIFYFVSGWKVYSLSRTSAGNFVEPEGAQKGDAVITGT